MYLFAEVLKYQRTEYGKKIRKLYESGIIKEKRCNMREIVPRNDGFSNTLTTVLKDNYLLVKIDENNESKNKTSH